VWTLGERKTSRLISKLDLESVKRWFAQSGFTDNDYLSVHFHRYEMTRAFAFPAEPPSPLVILDVGAHWLHNAIFYANDGHTLRCVDSPITFRVPAVIAAAQAMGATLHSAGHLEMGDGINEMPDSSVDMVLFCEIIEHLAFNPLPMWKQIYRALKPGGRIIVTTPNANHWPSLARNMNRLLHKEGWGPTVDEIMTTGTFGHHWKEFTLDELKRYFSLMSPDFQVTRHAFLDINAPVVPADPRALPFEMTDDVRHDSILLEITLTAKKSGITISPPWLPQYA